MNSAMKGLLMARNLHASVILLMLALLFSACGGIGEEGLFTDLDDEEIADHAVNDTDIPQRISDDDIRVEELGSLGASGRASIRVGEDDVSLLFTAIAADPTDQIIVEEIIMPDGESLYKLTDWAADEFESEMFTESLFGDGEMAVYLPVAPLYDLRPGVYEITLSTVYGDPIPEAFVVFRSGRVDGPQAIDMNIWLVSHDEAVTSPERQASLAEHIRTAVNNILTQQGMQLGQLNFLDVTPEQIDDFARSSEDDQPASCQAMADIAGVDRALNIIMVDDLTPSEVADDVDIGESIAGLSPSPGTVFVPASGTSCVTVNWEAHEGDFADLGATIVHEGSHFLSLQHTSEQDGQIFDVLSDTAECDAMEFDTNGDEFVDQFECEFADGDNYLFWTSDGLTTDFVISEDQAWVLRRHPLFYPVEP